MASPITWRVPSLVMIAALTWLLALLLLAEIGSAIIAWRGRVTGSQLCCGSCRYPLDNLQRTPRTRCPECGHRVWLGAVERIIRQPQARLVRASAACMIITALLMGATTLARFDVVDLEQFASTERLIEQIGSTTSAEPQSRAWSELLRRRTDSRLQPEEVGDVMAIALDRHLAMLRAACVPHREDLMPIPPRISAAHRKWMGDACNGGLASPEAIAAYQSEVDRLCATLREAQAAVTIK